MTHVKKVSSDIHIVAFSIGFKCPNKIHFNISKIRKKRKVRLKSEQSNCTVRFFFIAAIVIQDFETPFACLWWASENQRSYQRWLDKRIYKRKWSSGLFWAVRTAEKRKRPTAMSMQLFFSGFFNFLWANFFFLLLFFKNILASALKSYIA